MKQSELLRKQADMMDLAEKHGIDDWRKLVTVYTNERGRETLIDPNYMLATYADPKFALGVVEGKPVFAGDTLYTFGVPYRFKGCDSVGEGFSWNKPKQKTIIVELLVEDAQTMADSTSAGWIEFDRVTIACRKALEDIK